MPSMRDADNKLRFYDNKDNLVFDVEDDGKLVWASDVNLYRSAADMLKTDDTLLSASDVYAAHGSATGQVRIGANGPGAAAGVLFGGSVDTNLYRAAANVLKTDDDLAVGEQQRLAAAGHWETSEVADPAAPVANGARVYVRDNGVGKTQLVVRFATGAVQVIATEP